MEGTILIVMFLIAPFFLMSLLNNSNPDYPHIYTKAPDKRTSEDEDDVGYIVLVCLIVLLLLVVFS